MKWGNIFWTWIRPVYTHVDVNVINDMVKIFGEEGSIWGTAELRKVWFPDQESPPVSNILCTEEPISFAHNYDQSFSIEFDFVPNKHGAQAGVLLYFNDLNYVKYVIEGNRTGGTMLLVARQIAGEPKVLKKCDITCSAGRKVRLGLVLRRSPKSVQNCPTGSLSFEVNGLVSNSILLEMCIY